MTRVEFSKQNRIH